METINTNYFCDEFNKLQSIDPDGFISDIRSQGFQVFNKNGLPSVKNEEWRYTSISNLFKKRYQLAEDVMSAVLTAKDVDAVRLPGHEEANELVFINGKFNAQLSNIRSSDNELVVLTLEDAANGKYKELVNQHLGKSSLVVKDGVHALNTSFIYGGVFIYEIGRAHV